MQLAPTPKDTVHREGTAQLYRFRQPGRRLAGESKRLPLLLVPSPINRWYILDLREGASVAAELARRFDTYCFDWGVFEDEDRYLRWEQLLDRLARAIRIVKRMSGSERVAVLGYCIGGTLAGIHTALHPREIAAFVNLAGPFDFEHGGMLTELTNRRWFDPDAMSAAGNITGFQMQSGFSALHPTLPLSKWVNFWTNLGDAKATEAFLALEEWAGDNIPFPAAAYSTYVKELYQENKLIRGEHYVKGEAADLSRIACPLLTIVATKDSICPPPAATALNDRVGSKDREVLSIPGGHIGAVVGSNAPVKLYPALAAWLEKRIDAQS
jgi:poly[(R)-3-hydroxyalkanoate] polymerase subunit PhaC